MMIMFTFRLKYLQTLPYQMSSVSSNHTQVDIYAPNSNSSVRYTSRKTASGVSGISPPQWDLTRPIYGNTLSGRDVKTCHRNLNYFNESSCLKRKPRTKRSESAGRRSFIYLLPLISHSPKYPRCISTIWLPGF